MMKARIVVLATVLAACESNTISPAPPVIFGGEITGEAVRPDPVTTSGTGAFAGTLDPMTNVLEYTLVWEDLGSTSTGAQIHGPIVANSGTAVLPVLLDLDAPDAGRTITHGTDGSAEGTIDFKVPLSATVSGDSLRKLFESGAVYVNVRSVNNAGGELLGVITRSN